MRKLVNRPEHVTENVRQFADEIDRSPALRNRLGLVHAWYAIRTANGEWLFGPSKYVGYRNNSAGEYVKTAKNNAHGRETERALKALFREAVNPESRLGCELKGALEEWLAIHGRSPRKDARITVVADEMRPEPVMKTESDESLLSRIVSDPAICGGRPCIRGTRTRVSDILAMLAHGADREEILADYPWLTPGDIAAALAYAAQAADHRVIRAA